MNRETFRVFKEAFLGGLPVFLMGFAIGYIVGKGTEPKKTK